MNVPFHMTPEGRAMTRSLSRVGLLGLLVGIPLCVLEFVWGYWYLTVLFVVLIGVNVRLAIWSARRRRQYEEEWQQTTLQNDLQSIEDHANGEIPL